MTTIFQTKIHLIKDRNPNCNNSYQIDCYTSHNGYWRAKVDGKLIPTLVGFDTLDELMGQVHIYVSGINNK